MVQTRRSKRKVKHAQGGNRRSRQGLRSKHSRTAQSNRVQALDRIVAQLKAGRSCTATKPTNNVEMQMIRQRMSGSGQVGVALSIPSLSPPTQ